MTATHNRSYAAGRLLRSNGRWSLTHQWLQAGGSTETIGQLETKCGLVYEADEVYDGPDVAEIWVAEAPGEPSLLRCGECFEDGTGKVIRPDSMRESNQ